MKNKLAPIDKALEALSIRDLPKFLAGKTSTYRKVSRPEPASKTEVKAARKFLQVTQGRFAEIVGVNIETVKAWEIGRRKPEGTASRVIRLIVKKPGFAEFFEAA